MKNQYLGAHIRGMRAERALAPQGCLATASQNAWRCDHAEFKLALETSGAQIRTFRFDDCILMIRGQAIFSGSGGLRAPLDVAAEIYRHYQEFADLPIARLEGSFTLALLDGKVGHTLLYRNLMGTGFTYYTETCGGLVFSGNLAQLMEGVDTPPKANQDAIPTFFLYRFVPGRETLFEGVYRLMPGERLSFDNRGLVRSQRQTFADLREAKSVGRDAGDRLEEVMRAILSDCRTTHPETANLLSGGVDSSYLQAIWNQTGSDRSRSFSITVDHPQTRPDTEYALTAAAALGTDHVLVPADAPYATYLIDEILSTGEPPNHVQAAYFGHLARAMVAGGAPTGLCGEGADGLFGVGAATSVQDATILRALLPARFLRSQGASWAGVLGFASLQSKLRMADWIGDMEDPEHPVNRISVFADWETLSQCFGATAMAAASAYRRGLLDQYAVPNNTLELLHAAGFLGEAVDSASLWTTLFNHAGGDLLCPFLDSRLLRLVVNIENRYRFPFRRPKEMLRAALGRHVSHELAYRSKRGFGQPIFAWMAEGGQLRPWIDRIGHYDFVAPDVFRQSRDRPNWFLFCLLCYDVWHKRFIERIDGEQLLRGTMARATSVPVAG